MTLDLFLRTAGNGLFRNELPVAPSDGEDGSFEGGVFGGTPGAVIWCHDIHDIDGWLCICCLPSSDWTMPILPMVWTMPR